MKAIGAYVLTDVGTGKFYVGSSGDIQKRMDRHFRELRASCHHCLPLQKLWHKNGGVLQTYFPTETREEAYALEQDMLERYRDSDKLLNIGLAAKGGDNITRHPNKDEIVARIKATTIENMLGLTAHERKLMFGLPGSRNGMWGKTHTPEVRKILSQVNMGNTNGLGRVLSDGHKVAVSNAAKLRIGEKNPFYGKNHSDETKRVLSERAKQRESLPGNTRPVLIDGIEYVSLTEAARQLQVTPALIVYRMKSDKPKYAGYYYKDEGSTTST